MLLNTLPNILLNSLVKLSLLSVILLALVACKDDRFAIVQDENRLLKRELAEQRQSASALAERVANLEAKASISEPSFVTSGVSLEVTERMFDPEINGSFLMEVNGNDLPAVIFLELKITTRAKGKEHEYTQNVIHRFMPGNNKENQVEFVHPLNLHKVKSKDIELKVTPLTWYRGYQVK